MPIYKNLSQKSQGIFWAVLTCFMVSLIVAIVRHLTDKFHPFHIVMMRNFFSLVCLIPFILKDIQKVVKTNHLKTHCLRAVSGLIGMALWFYGVSVLPLAELVSLTFTVPIITTIAAMWFLKEKVDSKIWFSLIMGLIGVLIIIRPGFRELNFTYLIALIIPISWTFSNILTKKMVASEKPETITFYLSSIIFIISIPLSAPYLQAISLIDLFWFFLLGVFSSLCYITNAICYSKADLATIQPFDFTRLIFTAIIAYFAFGEKMEIATFIGAAIILAGTIIATAKKPWLYFYSGLAEETFVNRKRSFATNFLRTTNYYIKKNIIRKFKKPHAYCEPKLK